MLCYAMRCAAPQCNSPHPTPLPSLLKRTLLLLEIADPQSSRRVELVLLRLDPLVDVGSRHVPLVAVVAANLPDRVAVAAQTADDLRVPAAVLAFAAVRTGPGVDLLAVVGDAVRGDLADPQQEGDFGGGEGLGAVGIRLVVVAAGDALGRGAGVEMVAENVAHTRPVGAVVGTLAVGGHLPFCFFGEGVHGVLGQGAVPGELVSGEGAVPHIAQGVEGGQDVFAA